MKTIANENSAMNVVQMWAVTLHCTVAMCRYQCLCRANRRAMGEVSNKEQVLTHTDADKAIVSQFLQSLHGIISEHGYCIGKTKV